MYITLIFIMRYIAYILNDIPKMKGHCKILYFCLDAMIFSYFTFLVIKCLIYRILIVTILILYVLLVRKPYIF